MYRGLQRGIWRPGYEFAGDKLAKYRLMTAAKGPHDEWRVDEGRTAAVGNTLQFEFRQTAGFSDMAVECWFRGISLTFASRP